MLLRRYLFARWAADHGDVHVVSEALHLQFPTFKTMGTRLPHGVQVSPAQYQHDFDLVHFGDPVVGVLVPGKLTHIHHMLKVLTDVFPCSLAHEHSGSCPQTDRLSLEWGNFQDRRRVLPTLCIPRAFRHGRRPQSIQATKGNLLGPQEPSVIQRLGCDLSRDPVGTRDRLSDITSPRKGTSWYVFRLAFLSLSPDLELIVPAPAPPPVPVTRT